MTSITKELYNGYEFQIRSQIAARWDSHSNGEGHWILSYFYVIYDPAYKGREDTIIRKAEDYFDSEQEARFAAIGHITLLEKGES